LFPKKPYLLGVSVAGYLHLKEGLPCQDACKYLIHKDNYGLIAVADGLGSAFLSHIGAQKAVEKAIETAIKLLEVNNTSLADIPIKMIEFSRYALIEIAEQEGLNLSNLATTLITVAFDKRGIHSAQVGDGAVVVQINGQLKILTCSLNFEYVNEVMPITTEDYLDGLIFESINNPVDFVSVFTDGCQRAALKKTEIGYEPFEGFFRPVFDFATKINHIEQANKELEEFLMSKKMSEYFEDDKTLVIGVI